MPSEVPTTMIRWLVESAENHAPLAAGIPPAGVLHATEQRRFAALKTPKRRREWLLGRWTAKRLLQTAQTGRGDPPPLDTIVIDNLPSGQPVVVAPPSMTQLHLSISHAHGHAFCAVVPNSVVALGADIERVEARHPRFVADYFTADEQALVAQSPLPLRSTTVTAIWSAKEAVLKALHKGLSVDTRAVTCHIEATAGESKSWQPFAITLDPERLDADLVVPLSGWWRTWGDQFVLTQVTTVNA